MTLALLMLLSALSACTPSGSGETDTILEQQTEKQTTSSDTETESEDQTETESDVTQPGDTTEQPTETESESESETETETDPPEVAKQSMPILRIMTNDGGDVTSKDYYKSCSVTLENCPEPMRFSGMLCKSSVSATFLPTKLVSEGRISRIASLYHRTLPCELKVRT
ncbi:MAG: hypothetical protein IKW24_06170, partial [Clostridia bacterium]|nr:hypothetical protein [Clostridia bacterium]